MHSVTSKESKGSKRQTPKQTSNQPLIEIDSVRSTKPLLLVEEKGEIESVKSKMSSKIKTPISEKQNIPGSKSKEKINKILEGQHYIDSVH